MKQKLTLCLFLLSLIGFSQAPELINYQGIARDAGGTAITGNVDLKFELHQGSATSPIIFTEAQTVSTSTLGLFSTQIGKTSNLASINWQSGNLFLEVSLKLTGGTYTSLGTQQLVSVPFSMLAKSVPASYTNNVLTIGANAFTLTPSTGAAYTASTGISITSGSIITNTAPDVPVTFTSTSSNITVNGAYPNFSLSYTPPSSSPTTLSLTGTGNNSLSAGSNTVVLNTYTTGAGLTMSGGPNYTISSSASNPTIVGLGAAVVSPATGASFTVNVPPATVSASGNTVTITQGTSVTTATISGGPTTSLVPSGIVSMTATGTNSFIVGVPGPSLTSSGNSLTITQGTAVSTATVSGGPTTSLVPSGVVSMTATGTNSFIVGVPGPSLTSSGNSLTITQGTAVSTATVSGGPTTSLVPSGVVSMTATGTNSFIVGVPGPSLTSSGNSLTITQGTAVSTATVSGGPTTSLIPAGVVSMTATGTNSFIVGVPNPVLTSNGNSLTITQGTAVSTATVPSTTYTNGTGISITSGSIITNTSPDQVVTISSGNIGVSGSYPNFILSAPSPSFTQGGIVNITTLTANSYSVGVDVPSFTQNGPVSITGTYPALTVNSPAATTYTNGTGISITSGSIITNTSPDQIVSISSGNIGVSGSYPSFVLSAPSASLTAGGIVNISTITANSFSVSVSPATIAVTFSGAVNPAVTATGNSYNINIPPAQAPNITISTSLAAAGIATTSANNFNINVPSPNITISQTAAAVGISTTSANNYNINIPLANGAWGLLGNATTTPGTNFIGTTDAKDLQFKTNNALAMVINTLGSVGIGTTTPAAKLHVSNGAASGVSGVFEISSVSTNGDALIAVSTSGVNNTYALRAINSNTNTTTSYGAMIEGGTIVRPKNISSASVFKAQTNGGSDIFNIRDDGAVTMTTSTTGNDLVIYNSGTNVGIQLKSSASANFGFIIGQNNIATNILSYDNTPMYFGINGSNRMVLNPAGNLGIGNMSPVAKLDVNGTANVAGNMTVTGTVKITDGTQGTNKVLVSDATGNASWQPVGVPPGAIMAYGGNTVPSGWTLCDGAAISRSLYPALFTAIGTSWGIGDGVTTFNVPDMRGMFLRGVDGSAGNDPDKATRVATNSGNSGNAVGSTQTDQFQSHNHTINNFGNQSLGALLVGAVYVPSGTSTTANTGGNETRPKNVYVYYIIKH